MKGKQRVATTSREDPNVVIRNERIDAYFNKHAIYEKAKTRVLRLMVPIQPPQQEIMEKIEELIEELDGCFNELGYVGEAGRFDTDTYRTMKVVRGIADHTIRSLDEIPESLRAEFEHAFDEDAKLEGERWILGDLHRETEVIEEQIEGCVEELGMCTMDTVREGFEEYLTGLKKVPEALELLIENLNENWFEYKEAAVAVGSHYWGQ
jgi:hypothetical protein